MPHNIKVGTPNNIGIKFGFSALAECCTAASMMTPVPIDSTNTFIKGASWRASMIVPRLSLIVFICNDANNAIIPQPTAFIINMKRSSCIFFVEYTPALPVYRFNLYNTTQVNPNANKEPLKLTDQELYDIHVKRGKHILEVALFKGISHLILGAFGCGAFRNNPEVVARAYRDLLKQKGLREYFKVIEFAIIGNNDNYDIFKRILLEEE